MRYSFLLALSFLKLVTSSLYPTQPIADTIFYAGQLASITWIDDVYKPHLLQMGPLEISLYVGNYTRLTTLAKNVSPTARSHNVTLPTNLFSYGSDFTLRFTTTRPMPLTIYTADFTIFDNATAIESFPRPTAEIDNINGTQLLLTLVLPSTTIVSQLPPTPNIVASSTVIADPLPSGGGAGGTGLNHVWNGGISARSKKFDMEKFKFRLVYIVWPALVGFSMAM